MNNVSVNEQVPCGVRFDTLEQGTLFRFVDGIETNNVYLKSGPTGSVYLKSGQLYPVSCGANVKPFAPGSSVTLRVAA